MMAHQALAKLGNLIWPDHMILESLTLVSYTPYRFGSRGLLHKLTPRLKRTVALHILIKVYFDLYLSI